MDKPQSHIEIVELLDLFKTIMRLANSPPEGSPDWSFIGRPICILTRLSHWIFATVKFDFHLAVISTGL